ncbi:MAG: hypothetical protein JWP63_6756 [Candidatus Solibacter sp.]|jgi:hypothetical protein|nr:hypothetical protein [Candidatus Solibacter sp.]
MPEPPIDAKTGAKLAAVILQKAGLVPDLDTVMDTLGFGSSKPIDFKAYFAAIMAKLDAIKNQLNDVEVAVQDVRRRQTEILISITDAKLQQVMSQYERDANVLNQNYSNWHSALQGLRSTLPDEREQGARLLYGIYSVENMNFIEQAMFNIGTYLLGDNLFKGILGYMPDLLEAAVLRAASDPASRTFATVCGRPVQDAFFVFKQFGVQYPATITTSILPLFNSLLVVLHKGITLLEIRYRKTIQANQLRQHYANINQVCVYINDFWNHNTNSGVLPTAMRRAYAAVGPCTVDRELRGWPWTSMEAIHPNPNVDGGASKYPFQADLDKWVTVMPVGGSLPPTWHLEHTVSMVPPDWDFAQTVSTVMFYQSGEPDGSAWVSYLRGDHTGHPFNKPFHCQIPASWELFGQIYPPTDLTNLGTSLAEVGLLTPPAAAHTAG